MPEDPKQKNRSKTNPPCPIWRLRQKSWKRKTWTASPAVASSCPAWCIRQKAIDLVE